MEKIVCKPVFSAKPTDGKKQAQPDSFLPHKPCRFDSREIHEVLIAERSRGLHHGQTTWGKRISLDSIEGNPQ